MTEASKAIFWFRRDLRIKDNCGLYHAAQNSDEVYPLFIFDPSILNKLKNKSDKRVHFIMESLNELKTKFNGNFTILYGRPKDILPKLCQKLNIDRVVCNEDYEPYAKKRDSEAEKKLKKVEVSFESYKDHVIFSGGEVLKGDGTPYRVFTPYKKEWLRRVGPRDLIEYSPQLKKAKSIKGCGVTQVKTLKDIGFEPNLSQFKGGEKEAQRLFRNFLKRISGYNDQRDFIALNSNSHLSPYFRFGCLSPRVAVKKVRALKGEGAGTWLSEIIWREFYHMILDQYPHVVDHCFVEKYDRLKWLGKLAHFDKWKKGQTGYPIIDAAMIHLNRTGEMHNRLRMIVASFLTKDLLIDWRLGEKYFAEKLLDFDLAANNGGWQWSASTGCDAQPYFRIFNPVTQAKRFDPDGEFILSILPQLKGLPKKYLFFPSDAPQKILDEAGLKLGKDYPEAIVNHKIQRELALKMYKAVG